MEGVIWLFPALVLALICLAVVLAGIRPRPPSVSQSPGQCSNCETPMSLRRVSVLESHALLGEWVCPHCGMRMDRKGKVPEPA
jgi:DNA-directed RNA polymerase subunit RPC12/RpoP